MSNMPTLSCEDSALFYKLWLPLLEFINLKYQIDDSGNHYILGHQIDVMKAQEISQFIWENTRCIDEYLAQANLPSDYSEILCSWKHCVCGDFFIERHLKKGSVFIKSDSSNVYIVKGLNTSFEERFPYAPVAIKATLLPFKDTIITDGIFNVYPVYFGSGYKTTLKEIYTYAKNERKILLQIE